MAWLSSHINLEIKTKHQEETVKRCIGKLLNAFQNAENFT